MDCVIPGDLLASAHMSEKELKQEVAVLLFSQDRLTLQQARRLSGMSLHAFQHLLASRGIGPHYDVDDFEEDVDTLLRLGRTRE